MGNQRKKCPCEANEVQNFKRASSSVFLVLDLVQTLIWNARSLKGLWFFSAFACICSRSLTAVVSHGVLYKVTVALLCKLLYILWIPFSSRDPFFYSLLQKLVGWLVRLHGIDTEQNERRQAEATCMECGEAEDTVYVKVLLKVSPASLRLSGLFHSFRHVCDLTSSLQNQRQRNTMNAFGVYIFLFICRFLP